MDLIDLESVASCLLKSCDTNDFGTPKLQDLLKTIDISLEIYKGLRTKACLSKVNGEHKIWLKRHYNKTTARFLIAHEIGEYLLQKEGYEGQDVEDCANYLAAAILAPRLSFRRALGCGMSIEELAKTFGVSRTLAAIRIGEVTGAPCAVVCKSYTFFRGEEIDWGGCVKRLSGVEIGERRRRLVCL